MSLQSLAWVTTSSVMELFSYGAVIACTLVVVPCRAVYHLCHIVFSPDLVDDDRPAGGPARALSPKARETLPGGYEDVPDYEYTPLPSDRHIRLLRLYGCGRYATGAAIECELLTLSLDHPLARYAYQAISYAWDGQTPDRYILCEGQRLLVTENCETILRQLRQRMTCTLWIDAICIDQAADERATQIPLMADIYKGASRVVIWLGGPAKRSGLIFNYLWLVWCCLCFPSSIAHWLELRLYSYMMGRKHADLIRDLVRRSWWQRVWTVQEAALAPPAAAFALRATVVRCGMDEVPFELLTGGLHDLASFDALTDPYPINHFIWSYYLLAHDHPRPKHSFRDADSGVNLIMYRNRTCGVSDPKDRVYGVYGILLEYGFNLRRPNYLKTVDRIYWELTVALCQQTDTIKLIQLVSGIGAPLEAPSWVPDFNEMWRAGDLSGLPKATNNSHAAFHFTHHSKRLLAAGRIVDIVHKKSSLTTWQPDDAGATVQDGPLVNLEAGFERTIRAFRDWSRVLFEHGSLLRYDEDYETWVEAFGEVLVQGVRVSPTSALRGGSPEAIFGWLGWIHGLFTEESRAEDLAYVKESPLIQETFYQDPQRQHLTELEEWQALCTLKTHPRTARLHHAIWMLTRDRTFFVTKRGYMGTGPCSIEEQDVIVLLAGVDRPMVLRQAKKDPPRWRVVGPAYVSGMMEGQLWEDDGELERFCLV